MSESGSTALSYNLIPQWRWSLCTRPCARFTEKRAALHLRPRLRHDLGKMRVIAEKAGPVVENHEFPRKELVVGQYNLPRRGGSDLGSPRRSKIDATVRTQGDAVEDAPLPEFRRDRRVRHREGEPARKEKRRAPPAEDLTIPFRIAVDLPLLLGEGFKNLGSTGTCRSENLFSATTIVRVHPNGGSSPERVRGTGPGTVSRGIIAKASFLPGETSMKSNSWSRKCPRSAPSPEAPSIVTRRISPAGRHGRGFRLRDHRREGRREGKVRARTSYRPETFNRLVPVFGTAQKRLHQAHPLDAEGGDLRAPDPLDQAGEFVPRFRGGVATETSEGDMRGEGAILGRIAGRAERLLDLRREVLQCLPPLVQAEP